MWQARGSWKPHALVTVLCLAIGFAGTALAHGEKGDIDGTSGGSGGGITFPAFNVNVLSHLPLAEIGGDGNQIRGSDLWGWTDPLDGNEYALVGRTDGTAFVNVSDPANPVYLGFLQRTSGAKKKAWRDIKVYADHAYIVADGTTHGMQIFDLTQLRNVSSLPTTFSETAHYSGFDMAHNIAINQDTGYAYVVGTELYSGGPCILDLSDPIAPVHVGGFSFDGYTHDTQVVVYHGDDVDHFGKEIAFNSNTDELTIVDFTDKSSFNSTQIISKSSYDSSGYVHQGWLTEDHRYFLSNDELDELNNNVTTRTHLWDLADLDAPGYMGFYDHGLNSTDHNLYIVGDFAFEANYTTGLRVLDLSEIDSGILNEVAYIDTHPGEDSNTSFEGAWSTYPFFASGTILIGDRNEGLVLVELAIPEPSVVGLLCLGGLWGLHRRR